MRERREKGSTVGSAAVLHSETGREADVEAAGTWDLLTAQIDFQAVPLFLLVLAAVVVTLVLLRRLLDDHSKRLARFRVPLIMGGLSFVGLILIVIFLPLTDRGLKVQLLQLLGILLSGALALSSTSLLGNAMAGLMLRAVGGFRVGDYIRSGEHAGRVSERGLFHTEIQTEDRDLTTLPNLYLVTHPVRVARRSGTILSGDVSLGYDVPRGRVRKLLEEACRRARLQKPSVEVVELGDYSVVYRAKGLLVDPAMQIVRAESRLRGAMMDVLHEARVEIVSPRFMNTRAIARGERFIPPIEASSGHTEKPASDLADVAYDKADAAAALATLRERQEKLDGALKAAEKDLAAAPGEGREVLEAKLEALRAGRDKVAAEIAEAEKKTAEP